MSARHQTHIIFIYRSPARLFHFMTPSFPTTAYFTPCTRLLITFIPSCRHILQFTFHHTVIVDSFSQSVLLTSHVLHSISLRQTVSSYSLDHMLSPYPKTPHISSPSSLLSSQLTSSINKLSSVHLPLLKPPLISPSIPISSVHLSIV